MLNEGKVVGVIGIYRQEIRAFTDKQIELVQSVIQTMRMDKRMPGSEVLPPPSQEE